MKLFSKLQKLWWVSLARWQNYKLKVRNSLTGLYKDRKQNSLNLRSRGQDILTFSSLVKLSDAEADPYHSQSKLHIFCLLVKDNRVTLGLIVGGSTFLLDLTEQSFFITSETLPISVHSFLSLMLRDSGLQYVMYWTAVMHFCLSWLPPILLTDCSVYSTLPTHYITSTSAQEWLLHLAADIQRTPRCPTHLLCSSDFVLPSVPSPGSPPRMIERSPLHSNSVIYCLHPFVLLALWTL